MIIDTAFIKISSRMEIEPNKTYELGEDVSFQITSQCVKIEKSDNQDGTCNVVFVMKPLLATEIKSSN